MVTVLSRRNLLQILAAPTTSTLLEAVLVAALAHALASPFRLLHRSFEVVKVAALH